jgi:GTP-dependent dephospho-CoA kinase
MQEIERLKKPFGILIPNNEISKDKLTKMLEYSKVLVMVGDATTNRLLSMGYRPDIAVIDGHVMRSKLCEYGTAFRYLLTYLQDSCVRQFQCNNTPGSISNEALSAIIEAIRSDYPARVLVDGEEDLLALPMFVFLPDGSVVAYGQPSEGLVIVTVSPALRSTAKDLMARINEKLGDGV